MKYLCLILLAGSIFAKDLGVKAEIFPIAEESLVSFFQKRAAETKFDMKKYSEILDKEKRRERLSTAIWSEVNMHYQQLVKK